MRTTRRTTGRLRALVAAAALASTLAACGVSGDQLVFQRADALDIVSPDDGAEVSLPLTVSWEAKGGRRLRDGFAYGVLIDTVPPAPGKSIWSLVEGRVGCANSDQCRTEANLRARGAAITTEQSFLLDPIDFGTESRLGRHRVTVVVLDPDMRRVDENAYTVSFEVTSTKDSFASDGESDFIAGDGSGDGSTDGSTDGSGDTTATVVTVPADAGALPGGSPTAPPAPAGGTPAQRSSGAATGATATTFVPPSGCGTGQLGQGVTAETIKLGLVFSSDVGAANRSIGGNTWREGEPRSNGEAFVRWFNKRGGICGRKIVPVWADEKVVTGASPDSSDQAACTQWTQDNKIFAAMSVGNFRPNRLECLTRAGVIAIDGSSLLTMDDDIFRQHFGLLYHPFGFSLDRFFRAYVDQLAAVGYFTPGARVGLLYTDIPAEERAIKRSLIPALKAKGITLVEQARVTHTYGIDSLAASQTETNSVVLRFQTSRVSHVLAPIDGFSMRTFVQRADQQNYHPRLAVSSSAGGNSRGGFGQSELWENMLNVAWLSALSWEEAKASPGTKACLEILRQEGHAEPRDGGVYNLSYCGFLQFMKEALGKARDLTPAGLHAAAASLPAQVGDMAFQWKVTAGRHDGAQVIRVAQYNGGEKGQWRYVTGPVTVG